MAKWNLYDTMGGVIPASDTLNNRLKELEDRIGQRPEKMTCENCGAPLSPGGKCPYCGTTYKINANRPQERFFQIEMERPGVHTLTAVARIDNAIYAKVPPEQIAEMSMRQISQQMADNLAAFIRFDKQADPYENATMIRGTIRVVDPSFRF